MNQLRLETFARATRTTRSVHRVRIAEALAGRCSGAAVRVEDRPGALVDSLGGEILDPAGKRPLVAKGISHLRVAIAPELVVQRHRDFGAGFNRTLEHCVDV